MGIVHNAAILDMDSSVRQADVFHIMGNKENRLLKPLP